MAKIMLVEDDNNLREIYGARLLAEGHEIVAAKDGEEALALAVKEKPELIISDVMMPRISGFDMLDILRNAPETKNTKVIMMTALSQAEDKARADKLGADRYLVKSQVTLEDVAKAVKDVLEGVPATPIEGASGAQTTDPTPAPTTPPASNPVAMPTPVAPVTDTNPPVPTIPVAPQPEPVSAPTPAPEPVASPVPEPATPPASNPVAMPTPVAPVTDTNPPVPTIPVAPQPEPVSAPTPATTAPVGSTPDTPIKVELPTPPAELLNPTATENPDQASSTATMAPAPTEEVASVGPNLAEALQQEELSAEQDQNGVAQSPGTDNSAPSIINGAEETGVITPTQPKPEEPADEPPVAAVPHEPVNPLDDTPKKKVIEPINDLTKKPDLAALAAAEEGVGAVLNPAGQPVVEPENPPPVPTDDHSKIAL